jgi:hypothetical protein
MHYLTIKKGEVLAGSRQNGSDPMGRRTLYIYFKKIENGG